MLLHWTHSFQMAEEVQTLNWCKSSQHMWCEYKCASSEECKTWSSCWMLFNVMYWTVSSGSLWMYVVFVFFFVNGKPTVASALFQASFLGLCFGCLPLFCSSFLNLTNLEWLCNTIATSKGEPHNKLVGIFTKLQCVGDKRSLNKRFWL